MADERITRDLTPMVEIVERPADLRARLILKTREGALFDEDGRAVLKMIGPSGRPLRVLVDPDLDLFELVCGTSPERLESAWEIHLRRIPKPLPRALRGATFVVEAGRVFPAEAPVPLAAALEVGQLEVPAGASELHLTLEDPARLPDVWPQSDLPTCVVVPVSGAESTEVLPELLHGMGTGRLPVSEVRLRINPRVFQLKDRRAPFLSEAVEAVAAAVGCSASQLGRELALRGRLMARGGRRDFLPDPYFSTWIFRRHPTRGLVPATAHFPVPRRASRQEMVRGTPESEHDRLLAYLSLLEDSRSRLVALAARNLHAVSVHFLPNPDLPMVPNHGGICRWANGRLEPLG